MRKRVLIGITFFLMSFLPVQSMATVIAPALNGWYLFDVDELVADDSGLGWIDAQLDVSGGYQGDGSSLAFVFTFPARVRLTLVDAGIAGDVFNVWINGSHYLSSVVAADSLVDVGFDFDSALNDSRFSRFSLLLMPGTYTISGSLARSATDMGGYQFNATLGGLHISAVNEPGVFVLALVGVCGIFARHRAKAKKVEVSI